MLFILYAVLIAALCGIVIVWLITWRAYVIRDQQLRRACPGSTTPSELARLTSTCDVLFMSVSSISNDKNDKSKDYSFDSIYNALTINTVALATQSSFYHVGFVVTLSEEQRRALGYRSRKAMVHYVDPKHQRFFEPTPLCAPLSRARSHSGGLSDPPGNPNPCLSDLLQVLDTYRARRGHVLVCRYVPQDNYDNHGSPAEHPGHDSLLKEKPIMTPQRLLREARRIGCGKGYDDSFIRRYLFSGSVPRSELDALHCNTFVGLLLEDMGELPPSTRPVRDYIPGSLLRLMQQHATSYPRHLQECYGLSPLHSCKGECKQSIIS